MDLGLTGRLALVTGASRGIGLACARALATEGAVVVGVDAALNIWLRPAPRWPPTAS